MELLSLDSSDLFFIFVAFIAFIAFLKSLKSPIITIAQGRVPPGPPKLPVIGNLHQLKSPPHRSLAELASKHGPIMRLQLGQLTTTVISSADLARDILTTHDVTFANRPITAGNRILSYGLLDIGFAPYGPYWRQLRKICKSDLLSSGRVGSFRKIREDEATKLVREIAEEAQGNEGVNLSKKLSGMTYGIALSSAFGNGNEEDLTDVLLRFQEPGDLVFPLTDDSIKANLWDMVTAGAETSSATMEWAMSEMLLNPQVMERAQSEVRRVFMGKSAVDESLLHELHYLKALIKETLMPRESSEACEIKGYNIPCKSRVIINAWAIQRDSDYWPDHPERFAPERFLESPLDYKGSEFHFIPFGAGRRMCPGVLFAQANVELSLANLLFHFDWKLPEGMMTKDLDMSESFGLAVSRKQPLLAVPIPYRP
ncbi:Cytochrome P450 71D8 [Linum grandiflorum]